MSSLNTMQLLYPAGLLRNTAQHTWHPIFFRAAPRPSDTDDDITVRFRSSAHHTEGFVCFAQAKRCIQAQLQWKDTGLIWTWDGTDIPAITCDFAVDALLQPSATTLAPSDSAGGN